jgi:hypothetical protein
MHRLTCRSIALAALVVSLAAPRLCAAQSAGDSAAIRATALDYIEGWYEGDAVRMERALHSELVKRIVNTARTTGRSALENMDARQLVDAVRRGGGKKTAAARRRTDVRILDIFGNTASVRVDAATWVDYLHIARSNGRWVIVNVLWEER